MRFSKRSEFVKNAILELDPAAEKLRKGGRDIIKLNRGDPPLYFKTPKYIIDAYVEALKENQTFYSNGAGTSELKEAVSKRYRRLYKVNVEEDGVICTAGVTEALLFINHALIEKKEGAVIFKPYYPLYLPRLMSEGGSPTFGFQDMRDGWAIHLDDLEAKLRKLGRHGRSKMARYMLITNPCNPTGRVFSRGVLKEVVDIANNNGILLVSDEIYDEFVFNGARFTSVSQVAKGVPHIILNGSSKVYDSTGFRIGFMLIPGEDRESEALKQKFVDYATTRLSLNTPAEHAVAEAIGNVGEHRGAVAGMVGAIKKRVDIAVKCLSENPAMDVIRPNGTFYLFPRIDLSRFDFGDGDVFAKKALFEAWVEITRGSAFGSPSNFRIVALPDEKTLALAIERINRMCRKHMKKG